MLIQSRKGLYCPLGDFYIDPSGSVDRAVITHAHADHARRGSRHYYSARSGVSLLKARLGQRISVSGHEYGQAFDLNGVQVSFHPAGHILGSAQIRMEARGEVWVVSGDYKRSADPTCETFEPVACDVFVTEATFGTPGFVWPKDQDLGQEIFEWWQANAVRGVNSVLFAYSLGKTQRILGELRRLAPRPVICHHAAAALNECYRAEGVQLAPTRCLSTVADDELLRGELLLVPRSYLSSDRARSLGDRVETAFASGWMANGAKTHRISSGVDRGFVISDHADWNDLLRTISESRARRIYVQHRGNGALVRHLRSLGLMAFADSALVPANPDQMTLF